MPKPSASRNVHTYVCTYNRNRGGSFKSDITAHNSSIRPTLFEVWKWGRDITRSPQRERERERERERKGRVQKCPGLQPPPLLFAPGPIYRLHLPRPYLHFLTLTLGGGHMRQPDNGSADGSGWLAIRRLYWPLCTGETNHLQDAI